jgi:Family of unknown function (DUF6459)
MRKQLPHPAAGPLPWTNPMPIEPALSPDDLSALQILTVPDVWPPIDGRPAVDRGRAQSAGFARPGGGGFDEPVDGGPAWPQQFAVLLVEALTGDRPVRQIRPWLTQRGSVHLHRLLPLFRGGQRGRVQRVMATRPTPDVIEMTLIVAVGPRIRALAVRLTLARPQQRPGGRGKPPARGSAPSAARSPGWLCTDIEAA